MKRFIALLVAAAVLCAFLSACGKPSDVSPEMYDIGITALQVADDYMAYKIDYNTAWAKIENLSDDAQVVYDRNKESDHHSGDLDEKIYINRISIDMISANYEGVPADIKGARDTLAHKLGK